MNVKDETREHLKAAYAAADTGLTEALEWHRLMPDSEPHARDVEYYRRKLDSLARCISWVQDPAEAAGEGERGHVMSEPNEDWDGADEYTRPIKRLSLLSGAVRHTLDPALQTDESRRRRAQMRLDMDPDLRDLLRRAQGVERDVLKPWVRRIHARYEAQEQAAGE